MKYPMPKKPKTRRADDEDNMRLALLLAQSGQGRVAPNPTVGCVITDAGGQVIGRGRTANGGRPHAEQQALDMAGKAARGGTAYVTLEPCAHHGKTPPCADALLAAGLKRVVVAVGDPDQRVAGKGIARLRDGGIAVEIGCLASAAAAQNRGFFLRLTEERPAISLKIAVSADGFMRAPQGQPRQISGAVAQGLTHFLRAQHDAILIGSGTLRADNPRLDCRLAGLETASPLPVLIDRQHRIAEEAALLDPSRRHRPLIFADPAHITRRHARADYIEVSGARVMPHAIARALAKRGLNRVLLEGGARLATAFLRAELVDEIYIIRAPHKLATDSVSDIEQMGLQNHLIAKTRKTAQFERVEQRNYGIDELFHWRRVYKG